jgi:predicted RNA-binding protein YlxR (DUF448 family)
MPVRTCVGCRQRADQTTLIRVVAQGSTAVVDRGRSMPGRGANLHPDTRCLTEALRRRAFARALRVEGPLDVSLLEAALGSAGQQ